MVTPGLGLLVPIQGSVCLKESKSRKLVGVAGLTIRQLQEETGATISRVGEEQFSVFAPNAKVLQETMAKIEELTAEEEFWTEDLEVGEKYMATIVEVRDYGVMVELLPDTPNVLLHVSEMEHRRIRNPKELNMKVGDTVDVKYLGRNDRSGRLEISRKALLPKTTAGGSKKTNVSDEDMTPEEFIATFLK